MNTINIKTGLSILISMLYIGCNNAQNNITKSKPKVDVKVNKKFDEKGNIISYDSTYSYSFSDSSNSFINDSIFLNFNNITNNHLLGSKFNNPFINDSLFQNDPFFDNPFFNHNLNNNNNIFPPDNNKMLQMMDSLQNRAFNNNNLNFKRNTVPQQPDEPNNSTPQNKNNNPATERRKSITI